MDPLEGSLLLADISGFTNMSERLAEAGKEGAEWLTSIINQYFHTMLDIAHRHGGTNLKFGGDALLVMFRGDNHAQQAVTAARAMQRATHKFTTFRVGNYRIRLNMTVGVHSGLFWSAVAGLPGRRMQHFILGPDASFAAKTQAKATAGELIISETTYNLTSGLCLTEPHGEAYRVVGITRRAPCTHSTEERDILPTSVTRTLLAYLPPPIAEALRSGDQTRGIEGEHRKVIILFINLLGTDELLERSGPAALLNELQRYTSCLVNLADKYSGFVAGNDIYTDGLKLITIFGAPVAHEQDSANALRLALELKREMGEQNLTLRHRIGINSGFVFTGDVGPSYCRQYTVMGDAVNLSARLMSSSSPGQVLISKQVTIESGPSFIAREMPPIQVKGKSHPIPVCALEAEDTLITDKFVERSGELFGRKNEIDTFLRLCGEVESGRGWTIAITGEPGTGKSRLSLEFQHLLGSRKWVIHRSACYSHTAGKPFAPWIHILNSFFNIASEDSVEARTEKVLAATGHLCSASLETAPLLNPLLGLSIPQNDVVRSLDNENRRRRLFELIAELLQAAAADIPFAIILEDLHWADYSSLQIVNYIATTLRSSRILMCLTHRPKKEIALDLSPSSTVAFQLGDLPKHAALQIIQTVVGRTELPDGIVETILSKSQGNPLFLEEIARSMWQSGTLDRLLSLSSSSLAVELASLEIPDRIQSLLMSRVDTLNPATKEVLRAAAVVGNTFDFPTLQSLLDLRPGGIPLESRLQELARFDLISRSDDVQETVYHFKQTLIQEVAYSSLLFARRRQLHHRVASSLEETNKGKLETIYEVLVHHYNLSRDNLKTRTYSLKAADKAREVFAHDEAIEFYRLGLNSLHGKDIALVAERSYFLERIGDCYEASGHHVEAAHN
jgi:class 3 adenylate cyclase